jgi:hypothetical protein
MHIVEENAMIFSRILHKLVDSESVNDLKLKLISSTCYD